MKTNKKNRKIINVALAIALSMALWFYVINVENPTGTTTLRDVEVELQGADALEEHGLMVTEMEDETMDLKLNGRKKTLMKLDKDNVYLAADVSSITAEGEYTLNCRTVYPAYVNTDNVTSSSWNKMQVTITVRERGAKEIAVRGEFIGTEAEGCLAGRVLTDPATLELKGPAEILDTISYALVQITGAEVSENIVQRSEVVLIGVDGQPVQDLENITSSATSVEVTVPVKKYIELPLTVTFLDGGGATAEDASYDIQPSVITVAEPRHEDDIPVSISLGEIDLSQVYGETSYALPIRLPHGLSAWRTPAYASVTVSLESLASRQLAVKDIQLLNIPEGYAVERVSPKLYVWVRGEPDLVKKITREDIRVEVDLSQAALTEEIQRFPAQVSLVGEKWADAGVIGTNYSVALRLTR
ncbi:MAG: hypothetical protein IKK50_01780 [Ruminiclostridium sp.]|nr:hypothetical protein [Ruminiclostridium sp.]